MQNTLFAVVEADRPYIFNNVTYSHIGVMRLTVKTAEKIPLDSEMDEKIVHFLQKSAVFMPSDQVSEDKKPVSATEPMTAEHIDQLSFQDVSVLVEIFGEMIFPTLPEEDPDIEGNGVDSPMLVTLKYPIQFGESKINVLEFRAKKFKDIRNIFRVAEISLVSKEFLRTFATPVGSAIPLSDTVLDQMDFEDYARIRKHVLGKFERKSSKSWSKL
jgi:hypothetical protein